MDDAQVADSVVRGHVGFLGEGPLAEERFALPSGTVTFLLTDIEGSSRRWEADPERMAPAVARHYDLLDEAVARWGGVRPVEQGEGDSIVAAFARATDGVAAALDAQRALTAELGDVFSVRMALHTGEAQLRDEGNYFGDAVNRCARVRACGHGGQILCTRTVVDLVTDRLPAGAALTDLGRHRLRDLGRPEQLWQLSADGVRGTFPPLRSLDAYRHNLPVALSSFVGRGAEVAALRELLAADETRLLTVAGAGGCGKTRLALRLAGEVVDRYPGGVWWTELATVHDEGRVPGAVLEAVGLREEAERPAAEVAAAGLGDDVALLVLDNCEHLLAEAASWADQLLRRCPGLVVLATSREPLGVPGEVVWRVPSLPVPPGDSGRPVELGRFSQLESVRLFLERAHQARPNFALTEANAPSVAQICSRLDGIPLAIELAAARCRTLTPERIATELDDRFRLLTGGARTATPRQQTLLASVDWSHQLLDPAERAVFRRLSGFAGSFSLDAAEAVCSDGELVHPMDVLDLVTRLVDKSLVAEAEAPGGEVRFRMLETIRQYALDRCHAAEELEATRDRHLDHYLALVEGFDRRVDAVDVAEREYPNLRAAMVWAPHTPEKALRFAAGFALTWGLLRQMNDVLAVGPPLLERGRQEHPRLWARAVAALADPLVFAGGPAAVDQLGDALAEGERAGDAATVSRALFSSAMIDLPHFVELLERASAAGHASGDLYGDAAEACLCWAHLMAGHDDPWLPRLEQALDDLDATAGGATFRAQGALYRSTPYIQHGDLDRARSIALDGMLRSGDAVRHVDSRLYLALSLGYTALLQGDSDGTALSQTIYDGRSSDRGGFVGSSYLWASEACAQFHRGELPPPVPNSWLGSFPEDLALGAILANAATGCVTDLSELPVVLDDGLYPYPAARRMLAVAALAAIHGDPDSTAEDGVHDALVIAHERAFRPTVVECLETLAALTGDRVAWSRLLGAAASARAAMGFAFRWPHLAHLLGDRLTDVDADAFAAGNQLDLDGAVEFARRTRGARRRPSHGWASLTPTERAVVELVALGRTNPQIGEQLLMSRSTVKTHLAHVFTKLGVSTRAELAAASAVRRSGT